MRSYNNSKNAKKGFDLIDLAEAKSRKTAEELCKKLQEKGVISDWQDALNKCKE